MNKERADAATREPVEDAVLAAVVLSGQAKGARRLLGNRLQIGKAPDNDLVLPDDTVSRHHCELVRTRRGIMVRDLGSTNGTKLAGARVQSAVVVPGTVLKVGDVQVAVGPLAPPSGVAASERTEFGAALGQSVAMRTIFATLERVAPTDDAVLFEGEAGTGKDLLAHALVENGPRAAGPFVVVDCGAEGASLVESELFGHEHGAFTGAEGPRQGAFERADGGTLLLEDVGELSLDAQARLLRALQTNEVRRLGGGKPFHPNVRILGTTRRPLHRDVAAGKFDEDLYFFLAVVRISVPPLRARKEDVPLLVRGILAVASAATNATPLEVPVETMRSLAAHDWPGNVLELRHVLDGAVYAAQATGATVLGGLGPLGGGNPPAAAFHFDPSKSYRETRAKYDAEFEQRYVRWLLARNGGNVSAAAREARMDRKHLHDMAKKRGLRDAG